jgi:hypothetical protein
MCDGTPISDAEAISRRVIDEKYKFLCLPGDRGTLLIQFPDVAETGTYEITINGNTNDSADKKIVDVGENPAKKQTFRVIIGPSCENVAEVGKAKLPTLKAIDEFVIDKLPISSDTNGASSLGLSLLKSSRENNVARDIRYNKYDVVTNVKEFISSGVSEVAKLMTVKPSILPSYVLAILCFLSIFVLVAIRSKVLPNDTSKFKISEEEDALLCYEDSREAPETIISPKSGPSYGAVL